MKPYRDRTIKTIVSSTCMTVKSVSLVVLFPDLAPGCLGQSALCIIPLTQTLSLLHSLPSPEASQCLLLLLLMLMKEPLP